MFLMSNRCQVSSGTKIVKMLKYFFSRLQQIKEQIFQIIEVKIITVIVPKKDVPISMLSFDWLKCHEWQKSALKNLSLMNDIIFLSKHATSKQKRLVQMQ
jgi:hypothetical protein